MPRSLKLTTRWTLCSIGHRHYWTGAGSWVRTVCSWICSGQLPCSGVLRSKRCLGVVTGYVPGLRGQGAWDATYSRSPVTVGIPGTTDPHTPSGAKAARPGWLSTFVWAGSVEVRWTSAESVRIAGTSAAGCQTANGSLDNWRVSRAACEDTRAQQSPVALQRARLLGSSWRRQSSCQARRMSL